MCIWKNVRFLFIFFFDRYTFLGCDMFLNAVCDHIYYDVNSNVNNRRFSACQVVIQILIFFSLLLLMFDTYPYEVGLIGILIKSNSIFNLLLIVAPLYLLASLIAIGYRVRKIILKDWNSQINRYFLNWTFIYKGVPLMGRFSGIIRSLASTRVCLSVRIPEDLRCILLCRSVEGTYTRNSNLQKKTKYSG